MPENCANLSLPYAHLNLRRNPFGELSRAEAIGLADVNVETAVQRLKQDRFAVQFIGDKGFGKTTHLLAINSRFPNAGYVHIPEGETALVPGGNPVLIDEAQRLTWWHRFRLFRSAVPLVLGTHRDFSKELRRAGRNVETVNVEEEATIDRLHRLLNARVDHVRRSAKPVPFVSMETSAHLQQKFGGEVRAILRHVYGTFQQLDEVCDV